MIAVIWEAEAGDRTWVGGASGNPNDWNTSANWNPAGVPAATEDATIQSGRAYYPVLSAAAATACKTLTVNNGASLTIVSGGSLATVVGPPSVAVNGTLTMSGGTLAAYQDLTGTGNISMSGGTLKVGHDFHVAPRQFTATGGTVEWTGQMGNAGPGGFPGGGPGNPGSYQFFNVLVDAGVDPGFDNQANSFVITGKWTNNGAASLTQKSTIVSFQGSSAQSIGGSSSTTFYNLAVNNPAGVLLNTSATVNHTLALTSGVVATGPNSVSVASGGTIAGASSSSYVNGTLQKAFATGNGQSFTFPVGDASNYAPVSLTSLNITTAGSLMARTVGAEHPAITSSGINPASDVNRYWTLTNGSGIAVSSCSATFNFLAADVDAGANPASFIVQRYSGSWSSPTTSADAATSTTATGVTAFGDFAAGNTGSGGGSAPTLTSCCAMPNRHAMLALKGTAGLTYTIQASIDLKTWANIGSSTAGTNSIGQFEDTDAPNYPMRFYRAVYP